MIGIREISVYRPAGLVDNLVEATRHSVSTEFVQDKIGMVHLTRKDDEDDTSALAEAAVRPLFERHGLPAGDVECMIVVTQNPDAAGLPHTSAILHHKLGLSKSCTVFDISLGCSGYVQGLSVIASYMESQGFSNGLLVTADPYSKIIDVEDRDTSMIFGDGATATWLSNAPKWKAGPYDFGTCSDRNEALRVEESGRLTMNGRAVFNFAATEVPQSISRVLVDSNNSIGDIDLVLLHQGSKFIVDTIAKRIDAEGKTPFVASEYGNTVSSSVPMMLAENVPGSANRLILSGFGVGLAWATCLLERI